MTQRLPSQARLGSERPPPAGSGQYARPRRILVATGDDALREGVAELLFREGLHVQQARNGADALAALARTAQPDLIIVDLHMPLMDGWEFRVRQRADPALRDIPLLVVSADTSAAARAIDAELWLELPLAPEALLDAIRSLLELIEDRRVRAGRLAQAERRAALGVLAAGLAHEINNPLAVMRMNLQLLGDEIPGLTRLAASLAGASADEMRTGLGEMRTRLGELDAMVADGLDAAERIKKLVQDVRLFSRAPGARSAIDPVPTLRTALQLTEKAIREKATLVVSIAPLPAVVAAEAELAQVFMNLLLNAAQAIEPGAVDDNEIFVATRIDPSGDAIVEVSDTGVGIPPAIIDRIFEPFFSTRTVGVGTGLGLSVCHGIVTALDGDIRVESETGAGARFVVRLPAAPTRPAGVAAPATSPRT